MARKFNLKNTTVREDRPVEEREIQEIFVDHSVETPEEGTIINEDIDEDINEELFLEDNKIPEEKEVEEEKEEEKPKKKIGTIPDNFVW
jgi:hypothetical protein